MYRLVWGKAQQLCFINEHEYYQALGSLCRKEAYTITFETNSETESWGDAFRIKCLKPDNQTPDAFLDAMKTARRINCNDYVQHLYEHHSFDFDVVNKTLVGNYEKVKQTVPHEYYDDFEAGYQLRLTHFERSDVKKKHNRKQYLKKIDVEKKKTPVNTLDFGYTIKAEPTPVDVRVGEKVLHKTFGEGCIIDVSGKYMKIEFEKVGIKSFINPSAFDGGFIKKM